MKLTDHVIQQYKKGQRKFKVGIQLGEDHYGRTIIVVNHGSLSTATFEFQ